MAAATFVLPKHSARASARKAGRLCAGFLALACCTGAFGQEPRAASGWRYTVVAEDLPAVDNLAFDADGRLYATLELGREGRLVRLEDGHARTVLGGLDRPDGLRIHGRYAYLTEEVADGRVLQLDLTTGAVRSLARLRAPEGVVVLPNGDLLVTEDRRDGRLLRIARDGRVDTVIDPLKRPEGVARDGEGTVYVAETGAGRIVRYRDGERSVALDGLVEPDQLAAAPGGGLWITEDARPGRLLRFHEGRLDTIVSGLAYPQGLSFAPDGRLMLAEQGRGRILAFTRQRTPKS